MKDRSPHWKIHLATAVLLTTFLCYIDEGYYNFKWMLVWGNWVVFAIYVAILWFFQMLLSLLFNRLFNDPWRTWLSSFTVGLLGVLFMIYVVFNI
jgi:hypothetical protein